MANKFGQAALIAARLDVPSSVPASDRWSTAVRQLYPEKPYMQKKSAPRAAFLALCEAGLVRGIAPNQASGVSSKPATAKGTPADSATSQASKRHALRAVELLVQGGPSNVNALWQQAVQGEIDSGSESHSEQPPHNAQMDVVLALWKNGLIVSKALSATA